MPFHVLVDGTGTGPQIPAHLTRVSIPLITTSTNLTNKVVKGKVIQKGPLVSVAPDNFILKTVIQEEDSVLDASSQNLSINVVLFGELAKNFSQGVNQEDVVVATGFTVSKSPTVRKDNLHPFNLLLSGGDACIYVLCPKPPPDVRSSLANKRSSTLSTEVSSKTKVPKYTYVRLGDLTAGSVVNVYGVVVFFKLPFKSRGTDSCSILKITDQSNHNVTCSIFCDKLEDHPPFFQIGDIVRMHRVKAQFFKDSISLVNTFGFSMVTFDGTVGGVVQPRTSSHSFHFNQEDQQTVEELRSWASSQGLLPTASSVIRLSAVQPKSYFDLNCQLLAKAPIDSTCMLLRVWDGTRCPHTLLKVIVEPNVTEGPSSFSREKENIIANVLVYDNHLDCAKKLKLGSFLRIYNLRATPGHSSVPGLTSSQSVEVDHLAFHLHGGTSFGRGIQVLPEDSLIVQELKRVLDAFSYDDMNESFDLNDSALLEVWSTPPESLDGEAVKSSPDRGDSPDIPLMTLSELKKSELGGVHRVRAQLRSYEPHRLHQALKLYCSKCTSIQEIPDDELVAGIFSEASSGYEPCNAPPWALQSAFLTDSPGSLDRPLTLLLPRQLMSEVKTKELIFIMGTTLEEMYRLAEGYQNIIPVRSSGRQVTLLDLSAPFLFRGKKRHYGCKQCSEAVLRDPSAEGVKVLDEKIIAEVLGIQLLQFVLLMKLELQDATDTLEVFLWRHAESFFGVSAEDAATSEEAQNSIRKTMEFLCPPGGSMDQCPWLDLCLTAYQTKDDVGQNQTCYQICQTTPIKPPSTESDPNPDEPLPPPGSEITINTAG